MRNGLPPANRTFAPDSPQIRFDSPMKILYMTGFVDKVGLDNICANIDVALDRARKLLGLGPPQAVRE